MSGGTGHPLPASEEARQDEIPEDLVGEKGFGDDSVEAVQSGQAVNPDGEPYPSGDKGRAEDVERGDQADRRGAPV